jgi:hypothetical protein
MDNQKILLVNLSKGKMGEGAAKLLGMVFVMKFQAAAMSRVDTPEDERKDFCLYVDEFQNFATDSFESILSEARKFRLNLILANQFMTQLNDKIKGAVMGNVPTKLVGRIGIDDAEILQKAFQPAFNAEDLIKTPNYNAIATVLVNGFPSSPFNIKLLPPLGKSNPQLREAIKQYSASKYGRPRAVVAAEIRERLTPKKPVVSQIEPGANITPLEPISEVNVGRTEDKPVIQAQPEMVNNTQKYNEHQQQAETSFLDDWMKRREEIRAQQATQNEDSSLAPSNVAPKQTEPPTPVEPLKKDSLNVSNGDSDEVVFKIR